VLSEFILESYRTIHDVGTLQNEYASDPLPPSAAVALTEGDTKGRKSARVILPLVRGRAAEGGRGSIRNPAAA